MKIKLIVLSIIVLVLIYRRRTYRLGPVRVWRGGGVRRFGGNWRPRMTATTLDRPLNP